MLLWTCRNALPRHPASPVLGRTAEGKGQRALAFFLAWAFALLVPIASPAAPATRTRRPVPTTARRPATPAPITQRYAIYLLGSRAGSVKVTQKPTTVQGCEALQIDSTTELKVLALAAIEQKIEMRQLLDPQGRPLSLTMTTTSGGRSNRVDARFTPTKVECTIGGTRTTTVEIPEGVTLVADPEQLGPKGVGTKLKPGVKMRLHMFEPNTLQILPLDIEVLEPETITVGGKSYRATVMKTTNSLTGETKSWLDQDGELLQTESGLGIKMVRESVTAPAPARTAYTPPRDFAVATSIRTQTVIKEPRKVSFLRLRVRGVPEERLVLNDARQSAETTKENGKLVVTYTLQANEPAPAPDTPAEPSTPNDERRTPNAFLSSAPYLEVDDPRIQKQAQEIVGDAADPLEKARRIRAWVYEHMKPKMDIGVIRSATDVLEHPVGVCRDYAILYTALARAAGVPARVCGGIVYFKDGFFYHAWSEVQPSPGAEWIPFDATLPTDFVDATHIKFAQGDATAMFGAVRVVGQLKAEVLEYK